MRTALRRLAAAAGLLLSFQAAAGADPVPRDGAPWPVKVVIVTAYENGEDTGDAPGELQLWVERAGLTETMAFPGGVRALRTNADRSVVAMVSGMGLVNAGASVMALAFDRRFDVSKAYWLVAGVAGIDPQVGAIGDAVWVDYAVNDLARSIDVREAPRDWPYGLYPFRSKRAGRMPEEAMDYGPSARYAQVFPLDAGLTRWAYALTRTVELERTPALARFAERWTAFPKTQGSPTVRIGASLSSNHYWHGREATRWARDWVRMFTDGRAAFAVSDMEDSAIAAAMARLDGMGAADARRLLVLRAASNYTQAPPGRTTLESATARHPGAGLPAYEAAYRVGSAVVRELTGHWPRYAEHVPSGL
ncbi:purine-nucleoside phosphorylase [Luteimonas aquatica]|uniref:purine-nucleoside phosphorylase n=1 Tax=Luteimonas aquatica TaxID=450364 RepID=UPI002412D653|nr:purine nucleoside permease [Luteimonas aquatica]